MLEVQHPMDYFKKEREVNEPVGEEQHTERISKSHEFNRTRRVNTRLDENPEPMEVEQPGTSEQAGKKRPSIGEEDQSMVKKINLLSQEEDKLAHEYVKYFTIKFQANINFYKNYQGKTFSEMMNRNEGKRVASEILSGVVSALPGIFTHDTHKHGAIPAMTATSKNIFFPLC